jgi:uncharacterized metal-binding protein
MKGIYHELFSFVVLVLLILGLLYFNFQFYSILQLTIGWVVGTLYLSPDLDADHSRSLKRIGSFKYLFMFTRHRGVLHNPFFWVCLFLVFLHFGYGWLGTGLTGAALVHIVADRKIL